MSPNLFLSLSLYILGYGWNCYSPYRCHYTHLKAKPNVGGTVTYLAVKMAKHYPDKRLWAIVAFCTIVFLVGIATMFAGIGLIVSAHSDSKDSSPLFRVIYEPNLLELRYVDDGGKTRLSTVLAQSSDGKAVLNHTLLSKLEFKEKETPLLSLEYEDQLGRIGIMNLTVGQVELPDDNKNVDCFDVAWISDADWLEPTDCFEMAPYGEYWFGGSEMYYQWWPINKWSKHMSFYLSGDMFEDAQQYGSVLERYWLSSSGVALYVSNDVPLHVSTENGRLCFKGSYAESPYRTASGDNENLPYLRYTVCLSPDSRQTQEHMFSDGGPLSRPTELPDLRMMKSPIWSTWARYKKNVSQAIVLSYANEIEKHNFSNSQIEIDDGYEKDYGDYTFDPLKFPDAASMIADLQARGFRVTTWVTSFVNLLSKNYNHAEYFVKNGSGRVGTVKWWDGFGALIDFTNPAACDWYVANLQNVMTTYGVDSFKFDAGEVNYLTAISNYSTYKFLTNPGTYTTEYAKCAHRLGNQIEVRASWRTQHLPIFVRMMDKDSNWGSAKGLKTLIPTALTFSMLGYPYILPDMIGGNGYENGFTNTFLPERELYIRWLEMTAFLPSMQFSISPWQYDENVTELARYYVNLHETVIYEELKKAFESYATGSTGMGAITPLWWIAPGDMNAYTINDQFLIGERYLVAPIVENATRSRDVYLPGPQAYDGTTLIWVDKLKGGAHRTGGVLLKDYPVQLEEISWWERISE